MPSAAAPAATRVAAEATKVAQDFTELSRVTSVAQYQATYTSSGLAQDFNQVTSDSNSVSSALDNS